MATIIGIAPQLVVFVICIELTVSDGLIYPLEYNYLLNLLFPGYHDMLRIASVERLETDSRMVKI
ncbi:hypothetical protein [Hufsiella ginkgonis]|uniref:Uncharacterized protein n=1 Tax=Hufsiella ginkgonis TaxID=2695274 RepID=A0A7K1XWY6_9SPHI|nr:hypothetical protein [Hufsiella ginkgonis]MXV15501.1 hypothetical protein [Hufsiella ginkgonis]